MAHQRQITAYRLAAAGRPTGARRTAQVPPIRSRQAGCRVVPASVLVSAPGSVPVPEFGRSLPASGPALVPAVGWALQAFGSAFASPLDRAPPCAGLPSSPPRGNAMWWQALRGYRSFSCAGRPSSRSWRLARLLAPRPDPSGRPVPAQGPRSPAPGSPPSRGPIRGNPGRGPPVPAGPPGQAPAGGWAQARSQEPKRPAGPLPRRRAGIRKPSAPEGARCGLPGLLGGGRTDHHPLAGDLYR